MMKNGIGHFQNLNLQNIEWRLKMITKKEIIKAEENLGEIARNLDLNGRSGINFEKFHIIIKRI